MAGRPTKQGLEYFPLDVDFFNDEKIEFVSARFGTKGEVISVRLLCKIYRIGYYTEWNKDESILLAKRAGVPHALVSDIVYELIKRGFFDESIFNRFGILTSKGIQKRYIRAIIERRDIEINPEYWLIEMPKNITSPIIRTNNSINRTNNSQSKVKERKVKESKKNSTEFSKDEDGVLNVEFEEIDNSETPINLETDNTPPPSSAAPPVAAAPPGLEPIQKLKEKYLQKGFPQQEKVMRLLPTHCQSHEDVVMWLDKFADEQQLKGETHKTWLNFQSHFINWLKMQKTTPQINGQQTNKNNIGNNRCGASNDKRDLSGVRSQFANSLVAAQSEFEQGLAALGELD